MLAVRQQARISNTLHLTTTRGESRASHSLDVRLDLDVPVSRGGERARVDVADALHQVLHLGLVAPVDGDLRHLAVERHRLQSKGTRHFTQRYPQKFHIGGGTVALLKCSVIR